MVRPLTTIALVMASYSEGYNQNSVMMKLASSILSGGKYLLDPELRAEKVCDKWLFFDSVLLCCKIKYADEVAVSVDNNELCSKLNVKAKGQLIYIPVLKLG